MKISIITINYNNAEGLTKTINSVLSQTYENIEYIIIDGESDDESANIISSYSPKLSYWASEKDKGIYNAMNKGLCKATGEYCLFLNSGDTLASDTIIQNIVNELILQPEYSVYYGDLIFHDTKTNTFNSRIYPKELSLSYFSTSSIGHPAAFISTALLASFNGYSENYKIISDWLFFVQVFLCGHKFKKIEQTISIFDVGGISSNSDLVRNEGLIALGNELSNFKTDFKSFNSSRVFMESRSHRILNRILILLGFRNNH